MTPGDLASAAPSERFVVAFRGRRDGYQLPLALHEANQLETLITDIYSPAAIEHIPLPARIKEKLRYRSKSGLPASQVRSLWARAAAESTLMRLGCPADAVRDTFDSQYAALASRAAQRHSSGLFLYAPYAHDALAREYPHNPTKLLFQYHPHNATEARLLTEDTNHYREMGLVFGGEIENASTVQRPARLRADDAWKHAHHTFCASTFTRQSLLEAGADPTMVSIVNYGVAQPLGIVNGAQAASPLHVLFVGSGIQRKGLHHLLVAWRRANLPAEAKLTVVCRVVDPALEPLFRDLPSATLLSGISQERLEHLFQTATLFCMPSLVEGFGQVYVEALAAGLPVLGTPNTCLPDLGDESDGVFLTNPGKPDSLAAQLTRLAADPQRLFELRQPAKCLASTVTWNRFRKNISKLAREQSELRRQTSAGRPLLQAADHEQVQKNESSAG